MCKKQQYVKNGNERERGATFRNHTIKKKTQPKKVKKKFI